MNTGWVIRMFSQPRLAMVRPLVERAVMPPTMLSVTRLETIGRPQGVCSLYAASMCSGASFMLSMLISTLSNSVTVRPGRCSITSPTVNSS